MLADLVQDLRQALRQLGRSPGFSLAAIACLGLAIGANTAVFSFADFFLLRSLPLSHPDQLVRAHIDWASGLKYGSFSYPDYRDLAAESPVLSGMVASALQPFHLSTDGRNERIYGELVSGNYFSLLGVEVPLGRAFASDEASTPGGRPVVVLSDRLWHERFAAAPDVVGRSVTLNGRPFTVIGVAAPGFAGVNTGLRSALFVPITMQPVVSGGGDLLAERGSHWIGAIIGRLQPGASLAQAREALNLAMDGLRQSYPETNTGKSVVLLAESQASLHPMVRGGFAAFIGLMFGIVVLVLLLACANVAGLLLSRAAGRQREVAMRLALGASRGRLVRQLLAESAVLAVLACAAGLAIAEVLLRFLGSYRLPVDLPLYLDLRLDWKLLGFTAVVAAAAAVLFGLAPALQSSRPALVPALKDGGGGGSRQRLRRALVAGQVALSLVLLIAASLVLESLGNARHLDVGFEAEHQLVAGVDLGLQGYDRARGREFQRTLLERVRALPGVVAAGWAKGVPLSFGSNQTTAIPEGYLTPAGANPPSLDYNVVGEGYFQAMGLPLLAGRGFAATDGADAPPVVVVNEALARKYWGDADPLGKRIHVRDEDHLVIGLVPTGKYFSLGEAPKPFLYLSAERYYQAAGVLHVRTQGDPTPYLASVRQLVAGLDADLPVSQLKRMSDQLAFVLFPARLAAVVVAAFALLALVLAAVGLYAVVAYWVAQRVPEIGVRMALGAQARDVRRLVVGQMLGLTAAGVSIGLAAGVLLARAATKVLYGVDPASPRGFLAPLALLLAVIVVASFFPAVRATRVSPVQALRSG